VAKGKVDYSQRILLDVENKIREHLGDNIFGVDEESLENVVGDLLRSKGKTLSIAESCTGGLLSNRITNIPGSSNYFRAGIVSYSNEVKCWVLGVSKDDLDEYGAVSMQTAKAMAGGVARISAADTALAVTGVAGPGGGSKEKPVGTVYIAVWGDGLNYCEKFRFYGSREEIKWKVSQKALEILRWFLLGKLEMSC